MDLSTPVGCPLLEVYWYFFSICSSVGLPFGVSPDLSAVSSVSLVDFAAMLGSLGTNGSDLIADAGGWVAGLIPEGDAPGGAAAMLGELVLDFLAEFLALVGAFLY